MITETKITAGRHAATTLSQPNYQWNCRKTQSAKTRSTAQLCPNVSRSQHSLDI